MRPEKITSRPPRTHAMAWRRAIDACAAHMFLPSHLSLVCGLFAGVQGKAHARATKLAQSSAERLHGARERASAITTARVQQLQERALATSMSAPMIGSAPGLLRARPSP